jgi:hypothetical protein
MNNLLAIVLIGLASCQQMKKTDESPQFKDDVAGNIVDSIGNVVDSMYTASRPANEKRYSLDEVYQKYVSDELLKYIGATHPSWSVPNQNLWYPQLFNKYKTNNSLVNYVSGDFDCNGKKDYALILDKGKAGLAAVAFLKTDSSFKTVELTEIGPLKGERIELYLTLYKPGTYNISDPDLHPSDPTYIKFKCSSVGIGTFKELYEGGNDVYYWHQGELQSCVIEK